MNTTTDRPGPDPASAQPPQQGPRITGDQLRDLDRLRRSTGDRKVAGVAAGIARYLDIDPTIVRVVLAVAAVFGGGGLVFYVAAWLLVPEDTPGARAIITMDRGTRNALVIGALAVGALMTVGGSWHFGFIPWPALLVVGVVVAIVASRRGDRDPGTQPVGPQPVGPQPPPAATTGPSFVKTETAPMAAVAVPSDPYAGPAAFEAQRAAWEQARREADEVARRRRLIRGPNLWWPTVALIAIACGGLWLISESASYDPPSAAYPALALGVTGVMFVVGAWYGRTGWLYLLALLVAIGLGVTTVADHVGPSERITPRTASAVEDTYEAGWGRFELDLSQTSDVAALDGRTVHVDGGFGAIEVTVPPGTDVRASGAVSIGGEVLIFSQHASGDSPSLTARLDGGTDAPRLTLDIDLDAGQIIVKEAA